MRENKKYNLLGIQINSTDYSNVIEQVACAAYKEESLTISALAVHGVMTGVLDKEHQHRLNNLDVVVPDGQPVRWALNWLHDCQLRERVYGPTLMIRICEQAATRGLPIYLYGSTSRVLNSLSHRLKEKIPDLKISGVMPSLFRKLSVEEQVDISRNIAESGASIVFVGLGCPRQETWLYEHKDLLNMPMIAVGAAFNFHAGLLSQAPLWMQNYGLEWLFRLLSEPRRLWRRYLYLNPLYLILLGVQLLGIKSFQVDEFSSAIKAMRYG